MKHSGHLVRRMLAFALAAVMLLTTANLSYAVSLRRAPEQDSSVSKTEGQIIAENYADYLEAAEQLVIASHLSGKTITYTAPMDGSKLITVDAEMMTAKVEPTYTDKEGNTWTVGETITVTDDQNVQDTFPLVDGAADFSEFTGDKNAYSVSAEYTLSTAVDMETQILALNTPYYLAQGVKGLDDLAALTGQWGELSKYKALLEFLATGNSWYKPACRTYAQDMLDQYKANNNKLDLEVLLEEYAKASSKTKYLFDSGEAVLQQADRTSVDLAQIASNVYTVWDFFSGLDDAAFTEQMGVTKEQYQLAKEALHTLSGKTLAATKELAKVMSQSIKEKELYIIPGSGEKIIEPEMTPNEIPGVKNVALAADVDYSKLDAAVAQVSVNRESIDPVTGGPFSREIVTGEMLKVDSATVKQDTNRHDVTVQVLASVVDKAALNSDELTKLETFTTKVTLADGTGYEAVLAAIAANGVEEKALNSWDPYYNVSEENYHRTVEGMDATATLTSDASITIAYSPKTMTITYGEGFAPSEMNPTSVPYGYNLTLPIYTDDTLVYDYIVNDENKDQGDVIRILVNTNITRTQGKAWEQNGLGELIANNYCMAGQALLTHSALDLGSIRLRTPTDNSAVTVELVDGKTKVTATRYKADVTGLYWMPVRAEGKTGDTVVASAAMSEASNSYAGEIPGQSFDRVEVVYELTIPYDYDNGKLSQENLTALANLPVKLREDAETQLGTMRIFLDQKSNIQQVNENLGAIELVSDKLTPESQAALAKILATKDAATGNLTILDICMAYEQLSTDAERLAYYYANYAAQKSIRQNIDILVENFAVLKNDPNLEGILEQAGKPELYGKLDGIQTELNKVSDGLVEPDSHIKVDVGTVELRELADLILSNTCSAVTVDAEPKLETRLDKEMPGKVNVTVRVQVRASASAVKTFSTTLTFNFNKDLNGDGRPDCFEIGQDEVDQIRSELDKLVRQNGVDEVHFNRSETLPKVGDELASATTYSYEYEPKTYTVNIEGEEPIEFSFINPAITLPRAPEGYRYEFDIDGVKYLGGDQVIFTAEQIDRLFENGKLYLAPTMIDVARDNLLSFIAKMNQALAEVDAALILNENEDGVKHLVLRVSPNGAPDLEKMLTQVATVIVNSGMDISFNGEPVWDGSKLYLQAIADLLLNSGTGIDRYMQVVDPNGDVVEMTIPGATVINKDQNTIKLPELLGGSIVSGEANIGGYDMALDITLEDFDLSAQRLLNLRNALTKLAGYVDLKLENGAIAVELKSDRAYQLYLTAALALGYTDLGELSKLDDAQFVELLFEFVKEILGDTNADLDTFEQTGSMLGVNVNLGGFDRIYNLAKKFANELIDNTEVLSSNGTAWNMQYNGIKDLLATMVSAELLDVVAETAPGSGIRFGLTLDLPQSEYQALVIDVKAGGLGIIRYVTNLNDYLSQLHDNSVVILLNDIPSDLAFTSRVYLDLNGKTVNGGISGEKAVTVVDSTLDTNNCGSVTGTLTGPVTVTGGKFSSDVQSFLPKGYVQVNGVVSNGMYTVEESNGDINILLDAGMINLTGFPSAKDLGISVLFDIALNYYTAAALDVNGSRIYDINVQDLVSLIQGGISEAEVSELLKCVKLDGINEVLNTLIRDMTNFTAIADAIKNNEAILSYPLSTAPWSVDVEVKNEGEYITGSVQAGANSKESSLSISLAGSDADKQAVQKLAAELGKVSTTQVTVDFNTLSYASRKLSLAGTVQGDLAFDLSRNQNYAIAIAVIMANGTTGDVRQNLIAGIQEYYATGNTSVLKKAIDGTTISQLLDAMSQYNRSTDFDAMVEGLGLTAVVKQAVKELNETYHPLLVAVSKAIRVANIQGSSRLLGDLEDPNEEGKYIFTKGGTLTRQLSVRGITVEAAAALEQVTLTLNLFGDASLIIVTDPNGEILYSGDVLEGAFAAAVSGSTIRIYGDVVQSEDITVEGNVTVIGAQYIDQNGKKLILDKDSVLNVDMTLNEVGTCSEYLSLTISKNGYLWVYTVKVLDPTLDSIEVKVDDVVLGAKVDAGKKLLYLDVRADGMSQADFEQYVTPKLSNAKTSKVTIEGKTSAGLIPTGATLTITAENPDSSVKVNETYTIIILGDTNRNGEIDSGDASMMMSHFFGFKIMTGAALLAADTNQNGEIDSGDATMNQVKFLLPQNYKSIFKMNAN